MHRFVLLASVLANEDLSSRLQSELFAPVQRRIHDINEHHRTPCNGEMLCERHCTGYEFTWGGRQICWFGEWEETCECQHHCGANEQYNTCGSPCRQTCDNMHVNMPCPAVCETGCFCAPGYVRDAANNCIPKTQCPSQGCQCTKEYRPVCGSDGKTYSNSCLAFCQGVYSFTLGVCPTGRPVTDEPDQCICTDEYRPVCGSNGQTYSNRCRARCENVFTFTPGACATGRPVTDAPDQCMCTTDYTPVCGSNGQTYSNSCRARCEGVYKYDNGACPTIQPSVGGCVCAFVWEPVCGHDGVTYSSSCQADCAGVAYNPGDCRTQCQCTREYRPVCGSNGQTYSNSCLANCAGVSYTWGNCITIG